MIRKSLLTGLLLFTLYEVFLRTVNISWDTSQNDKSANIISAQNFLYNYTDKELAHDTVIVGTSVSRKLITDSLGSHYINLSFNAWNTYDGLELIRRSGKKPACILVETNYAKNQILPTEIVSNLEPVSYYSGKYFKSLQLRNQPTGLLIGWGKNLMKTRIERMKEEKRANAELYAFNLNMHKEKMNESIPDSILTKRFTVLSSVIKGFNEENIKTIFFEVPVNAELQQTNSMVEVRRYYLDYFPANQFTYVNMPAENNYIYSDGVHLSQQSALKYTAYLKNALDNLSHVR